MKQLMGLGTLSGVLGLLATASAAEFAVVANGNNPNDIHFFDSADPENPSPAVGAVAGTFVRGIDLTDRLTGYYVSMASTDGSPTGFFRLENGASTLVRDVPFTATAIGGLTFNQDETAMYAALNPPDGITALFRIELDGTFTGIAPIIVAGSGSADIAGIAMDPDTGRLYGLDNRTNSLIEIDTETGAASRIGTGLGIFAIGAGELDFALDGSGLYMATGIGKIFSVDVTTGLASPLLGTLPFGTGAFAAVPEPTTALLVCVGLLSLCRRQRTACSAAR